MNFVLSKNSSFLYKNSVVKFLSDMQFKLCKSKSCLISEIARSLDELINLKNTIERISDNLQYLDKKASVIKNNYLDLIKDYFSDEPILIFDDSYISKRYGEKFEVIDKIIDASDPDKKLANGFHVCESFILGKNEK